MTVRPESGPAAPYVGLRPFEFHEAALFYGRGEHIAEMVRTLRKKHFLAVVGSSGSGKSSLVRAGMLPAIAAGFMDGGEADLDWRFVIMRPGRDPYENLLSELLPKLAPGQSLDPELIEFRRQTLRGGPRGLLEAVADSLLPEPARLVVLVDQFEEIFRFLERGGPGLSDDGSSLADRRNAALAFVDMLLATAAERDPQVYIVLTMRSEYLGECEAFLGLSAAIARSQFLTPRMTREQIQDIIERPIEAVDGRIEPQVVTDLLNSLGTAQDQLPRVEHILLRMWDQARKARENQPGSDQPISLTSDDYRTAGGFESALDQHAEQRYQELGPGTQENQPSEKQRVAGHLFRSLAARSSQGTLVRRLSSVGEVAAIAGAPEQIVAEVVEHFRQPGCNFLVATPSAPLTGKTTLDISHEALLRQWDRLRDWLEAEQESAEEYVRLADRARLWTSNDDLLRGRELDRALEWKEEDPKPTPAWAERYHPGFADTMQFLRESKEARAKQQIREAKEEKARRAQKWRWLIVGVALLVIAILTRTTIWAFNERENALRLKDDAKEAWASALWQAGIAHRDQGLGLKASYEFLDAAQTSSDKTQQRNLELAAQFSIAGLIRSFPHDDVVGNAKFNNDQSRVLSWDKKGAMKLWDMDPTKAEPLREWKNVDDQAIAIAVSGAIFSPDGSGVLTWDYDGTLKLWDVKEDKPPKEWKRDTYITGAIFTPDGSHVLSWDQKGVMKLWDIKAAKPSQTWKYSNGVAVTGAIFSLDDGSRFLSWDTTGAVKLWDANAKKPAVGKAAYPLQVWKHVDSNGNGAAVLHAVFANDPYVLSWSNDDVMKMWNVKKDKLFMELRGVPAPSSAGDSSGDISKYGRLRISEIAREKNVVELWDTDQAGPQHIWTPTIPNIPDIPVTDAIFTRDGSRVFTMSDDGALKLWDTNLALAESDIGIISPTWSSEAVDVSSAIISPDGSGLLTWSADGALKLWDTNPTKAEPKKWDNVDADNKPVAVSGAIFKPDGSGVLIWDDDGTLKLWDVKEDKPPKEWKRDTYITGAIFTPDGSGVLTWDYNGTLKLWDAKEDEPPKEWKTGTKITGAIFTPDGSVVLTWDGDGAVKLWNANKRDSRDEKKAEPLRVWKHDQPVTGAIFTHDGLRILSWSIDGVMKMWPLDRGGSIKEWKHATPVYSAQFTKNDASILTWSNSGAGQLQSWGTTLRDKGLTPAQRILELQIRSATQLTKAGELVPLSIVEWMKIADE